MNHLRHLLVPALALPLLLAGCGSGPTTAAPTPTGTASRLDAGLGELPSFLPSESAGAIGHGTTKDPALSYPGGPVVVTTDEGDVTIHLDGPSYPDSTKVGAEAVECTFRARFTAASAPITLGRGHFDVYDHAGAIHPLRTSGLPERITPGQEVTVTMTATLPSGQGLVRWFPSGDVSAAGWDYVAETD